MNSLWKTILYGIASISSILITIGMIAISIAISYWQADGNWKCVFSEHPAICQNINKIGEKIK